MMGIKLVAVRWWAVLNSRRIYIYIFIIELT